MNYSLYNVFTHDLQGKAHYPLKTPRLILCIGSLAIPIWALYSLSSSMLSLTFFRNHDGLCHSDEEMGPSFHNHRVADSGPMNSRLHARVLTQVLLPSTLLSRIFILNQSLSFEPFSVPVAYPRTGFFTPLSSYRIFMPVQTHPQELHVKILVVGNSSVGKSSLVTRWSENQWLPEDEANATIGVEVLVSYPIVTA